MGDILEISTSSHRNQLCQGISRLLDSEVGCDFEISCADSTPIKAHFFVLQIFCRVLQNSNRQRICFESSEIQRKDVRCLLEFVYHGKTQVEVKRLGVVKRAAVKLGLETFLDLVKGIQVKSLEVEVEIEASTETLIYKFLVSDNYYVVVPNQIDTKIKEEVYESLAEDEVNKEEDLGSSSVDRDYTKCSEEEEELKLNVGKHEETGGMRKHLASEKNDLRSYQSGILNAHLPTKHQMNSNGKYLLEKIMKCDQCEYTCATEMILKSHIKNAHCATNKGEFKRRKRSIDSNPSDHACEPCGKYFKTADNLREHKMTSLAHSGKVDCEICGKKFALSSIYNHRKTHEVGRNRKFKCTICAFRCRDRFDLKVHLKNIHHMPDGKIARLIYSEATLVSDKDPPQSTNDLGKILGSFKSRKNSPPTH